MRIGEGGRRKSIRRGQPVMPKRRESVEDHPFRKTTSGFESFIPRGGAEDFFFSMLADPDHAAEFFERGDDQDPLLGDPRFGIAVSAFAHIVLVLFFFIDPSRGSLLDSNAQTEQEVAELDKREPLILFIEEPPPPPVAAVPVVPVVPTPPEPQPDDNALLIPKAMLEPERRAEVMDDLPFSTGNTEEFYTDEEVKDPGEEGDAEEGDEVETEPVVAEESGEDDVDSDEVEGADNGNDAVEVADSIDPGDLLFRDSLLKPTEDARREEERQRRIQPPERRITRAQLGEGGENGRFTDIRRFRASARFHHPEGGLVVGRDNTLYYNDKGANFVPWIHRMLAEVRRTWIASMPTAARLGYGGHTAVRFIVARNGTVIALETIMSSGVHGFDNNAEGAIRAARLLPLPADYPDETFDIIIVFWVNERPYDIFP